MAAAGVIPRRLDASVVNAVVLSGVGGFRELRLRADLLHHAGALGAGKRRLGLGLFPELVGRVVRLEGAVGVAELGEELPVGLGDVGAALQLALDDQRQRRALHAANREEVGAEAPGGQRDGAGQRCPPDQVDVLARGAGVGEVVRELVDLAEGTLDLVLGERRVARALDGRPRGQPVGGDLRVRVDDLLQRLQPDQLALAVEVGRDHDLGGILGDLANRLDDVLVGRLLDDLGVDQLVEVRLLPVRVALGKGRAHDVALQADRHVLALGVRPRVERHLVGGVGLAACRRSGCRRSSSLSCSSR